MVTIKMESEQIRTIRVNKALFIGVKAIMTNDRSVDKQSREIIIKMADAYVDLVDAVNESIVNMDAE